MPDIIYNFDYVIKLYNSKNSSYELKKIINLIDEKIDKNNEDIIYHIVPITFYFIMFMSTICIVNKLFYV